MASEPQTEVEAEEIPEARHAGRAVRGKYYEQATGKPLPRAVVLLNKAEAENRRLRAALQQIADLADAEEPLSVRAGQLAREALRAS